MNHLQRLLTLLARTDIRTVAATETVKNIDLLNETHTGECLADGGDRMLFAERCCSSLLGCEDKRTDTCVRTNVRTFVTLDTVLRIPFRNESRDTALLISGCALLPCAVSTVGKRAYREKVSVLRVDFVHYIGDEFRSIRGFCRLVFERCPCRIYIKLVILASAINGGIVHIDDVLTLLAI